MSTGSVLSRSPGCSSVGLVLDLTEDDATASATRPAMLHTFSQRSATACNLSSLCCLFLHAAVAATRYSDIFTSSSACFASTSTIASRELCSHCLARSRSPLKSITSCCKVSEAAWTATRRAYSSSLAANALCKSWSMRRTFARSSSSRRCTRSSSPVIFALFCWACCSMSFARTSAVCADNDGRRPRDSLSCTFGRSGGVGANCSGETTVASEHCGRATSW
mmetsp:Transcript_2628/g.6778  ORF Transcript_2628/g.6778 Transcript_2628/m.6778 type:complete len:222 (-) Transcript_2628:378-1043(-)